MIRLSDFIYKLNSGALALFALVIFLLFGALILPREAARAEQISGGAGSPDTNLFYTADDLYQLAEAYGPEGRSAYVRARYTFDLAFPLVYGFFLVTAISWFAARVVAKSSKLRSVNLVPMFAVLFDFLENLSTSVVMLRYPVKTDAVAFLAPVLSLVKWIFVYGSFVLLGLIIVVWLFKRVRSSAG